MRVIVYDENLDFIKDVQNFMEINEDFSIDIRGMYDAYPDYRNELEDTKDELDGVLINAERIPILAVNEDEGVPVLFYSTSRKADDEIPEYGKYIGLFKYGDTEEFIEAVELNLKKFNKKPKRKEQEDIKENVSEEIEENSKRDIEKKDKSNKEKREKPKSETRREEIQKEERNAHVVDDAEWQEYLKYRKQKEHTAARDIRENKEKEAEEEARVEFKKSVAPKEKNTEIISVFSAKGGTGKTTVAVQIAAALSRVPRHRGFISVLLLDFDYEFGDVAALLTLPEYEGEPLIALIDEVKRNPQITKDEIFDFTLQPKDIPTDTLYVIPAPVDYMSSLRLSISSETIGAVLDAIKKTGAFDYIVCDTGNNLNAATLGALGASDTIYTIYTPDYTTIKCNDSALNALIELDSENDDKAFFDGKFKAILNRETVLSGLEKSDIERAIKTPLSASIHTDDKVVYFNNDNMPIVFDDGSDFKDDLAPVIKEIVKDEFELPETKKEESGIGGFFKRFKRKRK